MVGTSSSNNTQHCLDTQTQITQQFLAVSILNYLLVIQTAIVSLANKHKLDLECAGREYTVLLVVTWKYDCLSKMELDYCNAT